MNTPRPHHRASSDRRASGRHTLDVPAALEASNRSIPVRLFELSVGGVGLNAESAVQTGDTFALTAFDSLVPEGLRVKIVTCRQSPDGHFVLGATVV